jgi:hypothetical protein
VIESNESAEEHQYGQNQGNQNVQNILDSIIEEIKQIVIDCKSQFP